MGEMEMAKLKGPFPQFEKHDAKLVDVLNRHQVH